MKDVIILDLETTGLGETDEIIEIGAVKLAGGKTETYHQLINPLVDKISPRILKLCQGITEKDLRKSPRFEDIKQQFLKFIGDFPLICHNAGFEAMMLENALGEKLKNTLLDSLELFVLFKPHYPRHGMDYLMKYYLEENRTESHRALADAQDTVKLVQKLFDDLKTDRDGILAKTLELTQGTGWGWLPYLEKIAPVLQHAKEKSTVTSHITEHELQCDYNLDQVKGLLETKEKWQEHFPGYLIRPQQLDMTTAVADSFSSDQVLFVEAPTGSGKTLGYLLPAMIWAVREKEKVFVSTNTKGLQQQVMKDLPGIAAVLGINNISFADMKGISNYACRRQIDETAQLSGNDLETQLAKCFLYNWSKLSTTGEIDDITYWIKRKNPHMNRFLNASRCRREDCAGVECAFSEDCFYNRQVSEMNQSHLCTINHSLLLTWPGGYPKINRLIIDEAHSLEEKAFEAFTREVNSYDLLQFMDKLVLGEKKGYLNYLQFYGRKVMPALELRQATDAVRNIKGHSDDLQMMLEPLLDGNNQIKCEIPDDEGLKEAVMNLSGALVSLARVLEETVAQINDKDADFENSLLFKQGEDYKRTLRAWAGILQECMGEPNEQSCCYLSLTSSSWAFRITPLDVAEPFYNKVISGCDSIVLTSATLAEKGGYERPSRALGFNRISSKLVYKEPLPHVYDYANNTVLAIPADSPGYGSSDFADYAAKAVLGVAKMLQGRTMMLFTSNKRMEKILDLVRAQLEDDGISVLGGRFSSRRSDLDYFRKDANAVLFGSRSYFEGIDIKGPALSCIIIDKLSFAFPDPLYQARKKYMVRNNLKPFLELDLAEAIKTLRQQFGRLIRSENDKGVVLVLDQLESGKWYCKHVVNELPDPQAIRGLGLDEVLKKIKDVFMKWDY